MKLITDYTKEELLSLKNEDIEKIVKLHLANAGLTIPKLPTEPEYEELPNPDKTLYEVVGYQCLFEKRETAEEAQKFIKNNFSQLRSTDYDYFEGSRADRVVPFLSSRYSMSDPSVNDITINEKNVYSIDLYMQIKSKLQSNAKLKENYNKLKKEYDEAEDKARETIDMVWETVREAQREQEQKESKLATFKEYLALADGNTDIAWSFMKKAYTVTQDQEDYINANK